MQTSLNSFFILVVLSLNMHAFAQNHMQTHPVPQLKYDQVDFLQGGQPPLANMSDALYEQLEGKLKLFYWNVYMGGSQCALGEQKAFDPSTEMYDNLHALVDSEFKPDVLVLSEFRPECWPTFSYAFLQQHYQKPLVQLYNDDNDIHGIAIFIGKGLDYANVSTLHPDWTRNPDREKIAATWQHYCEKAHRCGQSQYYEKTLNLVPIAFKEQWIHLLPIHLAEPWTCYRESFNKPEGNKAKAAVVFKLLYNKNNPVYCQLENCLDLINASSACITDNLGPMAGQIIFGDFNAPNTIARWPFKKARPKALKLLQEQGYSAGFSNREKSYSLSFADANLLLDQTYYTGNLSLDYAAIIPMPKSDHYPAYFVFDLSAEHKD